MAMPDATAARSESRIVLILSTVSQDGLDTSYVMRFWDIFSLAPTPKRLASLQRRPDGKSFYSSFLIQSCGSVVPIHNSFSHAFDPPLALREKTFLWVSTHERGFFTLKGPSIQNWPIRQQGIPSTRLPSFNRANVTVLTLAACPALQRPIPVRRRCNEAGLPI
jgi:hypothetical protein